MRKIYISVVLILFIFKMEAQEATMLNHYTLFPVLINPANTGFENNHTFFANHQGRWAGFDGAPKSFLLNYNGGFGDNLGLGAQLFSENIGALNHFAGRLSYAYKFRAKDMKMSIGLSTEIRKSSLTSNALTHPLINQGDLLIQEMADGILRFDAGLGFYGLYKDKFFVGAALPGMIGARLDEPSPDVPYEARNNFLKQYMFQFGTIFDFTSIDTKLTPSMVIRQITDAPFSVDFNLIGSFMQDRLIGGLSYRIAGGTGMGVLVGAGVDKFNIYYSYDVSFLGFQQYSNGSHEVTVSLILGKETKQLNTTPKTRVYKSIDEK